jgi:NADH:ubiquinone oxidoreductase subunit 6 (subunit J)
MTEPILFAIVAVAAVGFAIAMLLSDNAVHSALFLIGTMGCIAFMFLLLNAPFLAMIQITVYTGAIMVLFLFVIMLLGSERLQDDPATPEVRRSRQWFTLIASGLAALLFVLVGIPLVNLNLDLATETGALPEVRVLNAAPDVGSVNVYANDQLIASDLASREASDYVTLNPGDYTLRVEPVEDGTPVTSDITLQRGTQVTLVGYADGSLSIVSDDNTTVTDDHTARLTFFNGASEPVQLVDLGSDLNADDTVVLVNQLDPGATSEAIISPEGAINWAFVEVADPTQVLFRLHDYEVDRETSSLVVLTNERVFEGSATGVLRPVAIPVVSESAPAFGGPRAIGLALFTDYMLVFQLLALLLLAAMIGAIVLVHRETRSATRKPLGRRRVSRPLVNAVAAQVGHDVTSEGTVPELQEPVNSPVGD